MIRELFDVVDQNDKVIGITHKEEAHSKGLIHRAVAVYVFTAKDYLCVQEHLKSGLLDHSVGGHVSKDEAYENGARREALEELCVRKALEFLGKFYSDETYTGSNYRHMFALYRCRADSNWKFKPNKEVKKIYQLALKDVVSQMNNQPQQFTAGFLHSMQFYLAATHSKLTLDIESYKQKRLSLIK